MYHRVPQIAISFPSIPRRKTKTGCLQSLSGTLNRRGHQITVRGNVKQFLAVAAPLRLNAAKAQLTLGIAS
jgi:hypothetical protein